MRFALRTQNKMFIMSHLKCTALMMFKTGSLTLKRNYYYRCKLWASFYSRIHLNNLLTSKTWILSYFKYLMKSGYIKYNCNRATCSFGSSNKREAIKHVICQNAEMDRVPFACNLCGFRGLFQNHLIKHVKPYKPHLLLKQQ